MRYNFRLRDLRMRNTIVGAYGLLLASAVLSAQPSPAPAATGVPGLVDAARTQDESRVRNLLARKADVNARSGDGSTALLWAAHWNDVATAGLLIRAHADANLANDLGMTPLSRACTNGSAALVQLLLNAGANPNTRIATGETPLMTCAGSGNADAVRALLARGADVHRREPSQNQDALMWAAAERQANVIRLLVEAGANPRAHTKKGFTAIHFAAREGDLESVRQLLAAGVDVNIRSQPDEPVESARETPGGTAPYTATATVPPRPVDSRPVWDDEAGAWVDGRIYRWDELRQGHVLRGPAVVEGMDSTVWIPSGAAATVDETGAMLLELAPL